MPDNPPSASKIFHQKFEPMSPFADPMVGAIFANADVAGEAAQSLIGAVIAEDNVHIGNIIEVTPQRYNRIYPAQRGCRVDVIAQTDNNETVIFEVNLYSDASIFHRDWFSAAQITAASLPVGTPSSDMPVKLPKIIVINILADNIREDNSDFLQPIKLLYTKPPHRTAFDHLVIYNIQLPQFEKTKIDWSDNLHCWLYALDTAKLKNLTIEEVIAMTPQLQDFAKYDIGFRQFGDRYAYAISDPAVRQEYVMWVNDLMREQGRYESAIQKGRLEGKIEGRLEGMIEGEIKGKIEFAQNLLSMGLLTPQQVAEAAKLPLADILALRDAVQG
jgi:predicted transposase/invertase (TIGR01784 family)